MQIVSTDMKYIQVKLTYFEINLNKFNIVL